MSGLSAASGAALPPGDDEAIAALASLQELSPPDALPVLERMLAAVRATGRMRVQGQVLCHLARCRCMLGENAAADAAAAEALGLFQSLGLPAGQALALNAQTMLLLARGDYATALERLAQALPLARQAADNTLLAGLLNSLGSTFHDIGDPSAASAAYEECLNVLPADVWDFRHAAVRGNLALALARWAEQDRARGLPEDDWMPRARRAIALVSDLPADQNNAVSQAQVIGMESLSVALRVSGDAAQALSVLDHPSVHEAEQSSPYHAVHFAEARARALLALGRIGEAVQECERALAVAQRADSEVYCDMLYLTLSLAHEEAGDPARALQAHRQFHALRARLVFERATRAARSMVSQLELDRALRESRIDALTGLVNRRGFDERMQSLLPAVEPARPLSLLLIDVDEFKAINDSLGHPAGDAVLKRLGALLQTLCRGSEPPARLGGDEFAVLVEGSQDQGLALAGRIHAALEADPGRDTARVKVSIGLAEARLPCDPEAFLARADRALYAVKRQGRNGMRAAR